MFLVQKYPEILDRVKEGDMRDISSLKNMVDTNQFAYDYQARWSFVALRRRRFEASQPEKASMGKHIS